MMYNYINISYRGIQGETAKMEGVVKKYRLSIYILLFYRFYQCYIKIGGVFCV